MFTLLIVVDNSFEEGILPHMFNWLTCSTCGAKFSLFRNLTVGHVKCASCEEADSLAEQKQEAEAWLKLEEFIRQAWPAKHYLSYFFVSCPKPNEPPPSSPLGGLTDVFKAFASGAVGLSGPWLMSIGGNSTPAMAKYEPGALVMFEDGFIGVLTASGRHSTCDIHQFRMTAPVTYSGVGTTVGISKGFEGFFGVRDWLSGTDHLWLLYPKSEKSKANAREFYELWLRQWRSANPHK